MKFRNPTPAERVTQLEAKVKSLMWKDWQVPTAGQFEIYCELWEEYLTAKAEAGALPVSSHKVGEPPCPGLLPEMSLSGPEAHPGVPADTVHLRHCGHDR